MKSNEHYFDIIVIGAGHAGIEAAAAAARMGCSVALVTISKENIGHMPCNPAIGGIGKGHIVFEISALGGVMPQLCTQTYLQGNMLNKSKGPAVQGLRLQIDKVLYKEAARKKLETYKNVTIIEEIADQLLKNDNGEIIGITTIQKNTYHSRSVVITTGTFLNGLIHIGLTNFPAGRKDEPAVTGLAQSIYSLGLRMGRLKTGTPPRLEKQSVSLEVMEEQKSHDLEFLFEFTPHTLTHKHSCYITRTNTTTHEIVKENAHLSPVYKKIIQGAAPRYCPSFEDKVNRFAHKDSHHIFVEPESMFIDELYPNGLSTSLPADVQLQFIRSIRGFENAKIATPGYAIEYDFVYPNQLHHTLEVKSVPGLFLAGQINGTTGYEEAAGQGIIAGINAAAKVLSKDPFILHREESYIGIMIDDLVTLGVDEPYRMFTSRAERRLSLRQDNVFYRLYKKAFSYTLIDKIMHDTIEEEYKNSQTIISHIMSTPKKISAIAQLFSAGKDEDVKKIIDEKSGEIPLNARQKEYVYGELLYAPYHQREEVEKKKLIEYRELKIPAHFEYKNIAGLSTELQQKLTQYRPATIAQASLIQGMTPAGLSLLIFRVREAQK